MGTPSFSSFLCTKPFKVIGPNGKRFYAHGDLLAQHSSVLSSDIKGKMVEAETKTIKIEDVDKDIDDDTVMRFLEYLYRGDYTVPDPDVLQLPTDGKVVAEAFTTNGGHELANSSEEVPVAEGGSYNQNHWVEPVEDICDSHEPNGWGFGGSDSMGLRKKDKKKKRRFIEPEPEPAFEIEPEPEPEPIVLEEASYQPGTNVLTQPAIIEDPSKSNWSYTTRATRWKNFKKEALVPTIKTWEPTDNNDPREDFTKIFICHAQLYKFSERYDISGLMTLSLQKLYATLSRYQFYQERAESVVELIRYTYTHTMDYESGCDKLRRLVLDYAICYVIQLERESTFVEMLRANNHLASDLLSELVKMIG